MRTIFTRKIGDSRPGSERFVEVVENGPWVLRGLHRDLHQQTLGRSQVGQYHDRTRQSQFLRSGEVRLCLPFPNWDQFELQLPARRSSVVSIPRVSNSLPTIRRANLLVSEKRHDC